MRHSCCLWTVSFLTVLTIALCAFSFPFPWVRPKLCSTCYLRFAIPAVRYSIIQPFGNIHFRTLPTTASADFSQLVVTTVSFTACETSRDKPASLSSSTCLIYAHGLRLPLGLRCLGPAYPPSATTPLADFHHRLTACPSYPKKQHWQ